MRELCPASAKEMMELGRKYASTLKQGDVVCLDGVLGSGKTTFVKGVAQGLGVQECVTSPTFGLIHVYQSSPMLYHMDLYRLGSIEEFYLIGGEDYIGNDGVCLIEWSYLIRDLWPPHTKFVEFSLQEEGRRLVFLN